MTDFGSQTLYEDARPPVVVDPPVAERIELPIPEEIPTVLPPTLDKIVNGHDTFPLEDDWFGAVDEQEPPQRPKKAKTGLKGLLKWPNMSFDFREFTSIFVEAAGMAAISVGFWQIRPWCGLVVGGLCLILIGMAISRDPDSAP